MIKILDSFIADKIAAGEVIERPVSIVKELVENSIDAGASSIIVEIRNGGKSYIRITDDGCGIPADEIEIAFERHATSKISNIDDLDNIRSLGFRGEALASISAISRLTIVSKTADAAYGMKLTIHGGNKISSETVGTNDGTTIVIEDVFYNTPARRKFMGTDAREASAIIELIEHYGIYYSDIRFMLINNGKTIFTTSGNGDILNAIRTVYPTSDYSNLIQINSDHLLGYISDPGTTKSSRRGQLFFVNGRLVDSKVIEKGIEKGYGSRIFSGYPIAILFINIEPDLIDVNIHPGKKEIKFLYPDRIVEEISSTINNLMYTNESVPRASGLNLVIENLDDEQNQEKFSFDDIKNIDDGSSISVQEEIKNDELQQEAVEQSIEESNDIPDVKPEPLDEIRQFLSDIKRDISDFTADITPPLYSVKEEIKNIYEPEPFNFSGLEFAGYLFNAYIIMQKNDEIFVFDQHAAHERIFYEYFIKNYNNADQLPQPIINPIIIYTTADVYEADRFWMNTMANMGFDINDFGNNTFIIRGIPSYMSALEAEEFANTFIDSAEEYDNNQVVIDKLIMKSCKSAVKANEKLSSMEISDLIDKLSHCENPFCCPHGRPTFVKLSKYDIERSFKRK